MARRLPGTRLRNDYRVSVVEDLRRAGCVYAEDEARILMNSASTPDDLATMVAQRVAGDPLEYIVGWAEFHGTRVKVTRGVFVPRRRSEFLVECGIRLIDRLGVTPTGHSPVVLDLCCGTGALGLTVAVHRSVELISADIDPVAVACARENLNGLATVVEGDLFEPVARDLQGRIDVLLANVPYVPSDARRLLPRESRDFENPVAIDGGRDGLAILRRVAAQAELWLRPGRSVLLEVGQAQVDAAEQIIRESRLQPRLETSPDGDTTVLVGTKAEKSVS